MKRIDNEDEWRTECQHFWLKQCPFDLKDDHDLSEVVKKRPHSWTETKAVGEALACIRLLTRQGSLKFSEGMYRIKEVR